MTAALVVLVVTGVVVSTWQAVRATRAEGKEKVQRTWAEHLRATAEAALYQARLSENRALRLARPQGWSELAFANLSSNAAMSLPQRDLLELRSEAVACLGQLDVREVARFGGRSNGVWSLDFSPDGAMLASADGRGIMRVWEVAGPGGCWEMKDPAATGGAFQAAFGTNPGHPV